MHCLLTNHAKEKLNQLTDNDKKLLKKFFTSIENMRNINELFRISKRVQSLVNGVDDTYVCRISNCHVFYTTFSKFNETVILVLTVVKHF